MTGKKGWLVKHHLPKSRLSKHHLLVLLQTNG